MKWAISIIALCLTLNNASLSFADIDAEVAASRGSIERTMKDARTLVLKGQTEEATKAFLDVFPEDKRTPVQSLMLGDILFQQDHKVSYDLHKAAFKGLPNELRVQYEWGLEQHRAGEFAGAADCYAAFIKVNPNYAPVLGLTAECLLRTGKTKEAMKVWNDSERGRGSIEALEKLVFEVHNHKMLDKDRAEYLKKAKTGDIEAAQKLIVLDCDYEHDWWNKETHEEYLQHDVAQLKKINFADKAIAREIIVTGEVAIQSNGNKNAIRKLLDKEGLLTDTNKTLPKSAAMISCLLGQLEKAGLYNDIKSEVRNKWNDELLERSKDSKDPELFNVLAHINLKSDKLFDIQKRGWEQTGDERFAVSYIIALYAKEGLKLESPELTKALKAFPENAFLCRVVLELSEKEGRPLEEPLIAAIKAEYAHFSLQPPFNMRVGAANLRRYWAKLDKVLVEKK